MALNLAAKGRSPSRGLAPILRRIGTEASSRAPWPVHCLPPGLGQSTSLLPCQSSAGGRPTGLDLCACSCPRLRLQPDCGWRSLRRSSRLFDSSLGFPGEGSRVSKFGVLLFRAMARWFPETRRTGRDRLPGLSRLLSAGSTRGGSLDDICGIGPQFVSEANKHLADYGRELFRAGWPYFHFSEVINAVSSSRVSAAAFSLPGMLPSRG